MSKSFLIDIKLTAPPFPPVLLGKFHLNLTYPMTNTTPMPPAGLFHEANNIIVTGGEFKAVSNVFNPHTHTIGPGGSDNHDGISFLRSYSATAGLLNARERFDAPKCDEDTRISMIRGMKDWVQSGDESSGSSMFWLHGPAGVGKSALAQSLALILEKEGDHAASFFFSRTAPGRNNGGQLIATLACQLAVHIPQIRPFLAKSIQDNPFVLESSNTIQMGKLIIQPLSDMQRKYQRSHGRLSKALRFIRKLGWGSSTRSDQRSEALKVPRLILVDGLDECEGSAVQADLILCLGRAVRDIGLPFRVIIVSRPESHILATFRLNQLFSSPGGVTITEQNLGEDPDADQSIAVFLLKEFSEIRRTHPLRKYLPEVWPMQADVEHLVRKSSKSFIYAATVIRYIKLPNNRPEECLERILGMAEIPSFDKPYEILDNLYHHIFESVPDVNKKSVVDIFHVLIVGTGLQTHPRLGSCTTPAIIERILSFAPGHVEHVLGDLLCVVNISTAHQPIVILHASLSDFFLDAVRARHLYINPGDIHAMIAQGYYRMYIESQGRLVHGCNRLLMHSVLASRSDSLLHRLRSVDLVQCHRWAYSRLCSPEGTHSEFIDASLSLASFLLVLSEKGYQADAIFVDIVDSLRDSLLSSFPAVEAVYERITDFEPFVTPLLQAFHQSHWFLAPLLKDLDYGAMPQEITRAHILCLIPIFLPTGIEAQTISLSDKATHARLSVLWIESLFRIDPRSDDYIVTPLCLALIGTSLTKATFDLTLIHFLKSFSVYASNAAFMVTTDDLRRLEIMVLKYFKRIKADPLAEKDLLSNEVEVAESVWKGLASQWAFHGNPKSETGGYGDRRFDVGEVDEHEAGDLEEWEAIYGTEERS